MATMTDDEVSRAIDGIERALESEDPAFTRRVGAVARPGITRVVMVVVLLAASAVLLTVGLATRSWVAWCAGAITFLAAFGFDDRRERRRANRDARQLI